MWNRVIPANSRQGNNLIRKSSNNPSLFISAIRTYMAEIHRLTWSRRGASVRGRPSPICDHSRSLVSTSARVCRPSSGGVEHKCLRHVRRLDFAKDGRRIDPLRQRERGDVHDDRTCLATRGRKALGPQRSPPLERRRSSNDGKIGEIWYERTDPAAHEPSLLLKLLFTLEPLSVQVHPGDAFARSMGEARGKSEAWYVLSAEPGSRIALGLDRRLTSEQLREAIADGSIAEADRLAASRVWRCRRCSGGLHSRHRSRSRNRRNPTAQRHDLSSLRLWATPGAAR